jgi:aminoglycoside phosphotransferase (APT) family kinase protein
MTIDGRKAIVYDRVEGPTLQDYLIRHPWSVRGWAIRMAELHADIHAHTLSEASTRKAVLRQRIERQRKLSESVRDAVLGEIESLPEGQSVCHGDFHPGNILLSPRGPVVIDWPDAYIGDPASDVARTTLLLLLAPLHAKGARRLYARLLLRRIYKHYLRRYLQITGVGYDRIKAWLPVLAAARLAEGFSEEEELLTVIIAVG